MDHAIKIAHIDPFLYSLRCYVAQMLNNKPYPGVLVYRYIRLQRKGSTMLDILQSRFKQRL